MKALVAQLKRFGRRLFGLSHPSQAEAEWQAIQERQRRVDYAITQMLQLRAYVRQRTKDAR